ncbi:cytochrome c oxidase subunit 3 [Corynebacterium lubricantis]|uniref:aa3-type cytochrome oxidase subunit III n=1 Tax=Corynebacterium lubricantis TaxID=541095 RepID=UPI00036DBA1B|nr:heme-copper oxidase subunit III [Corynebacterium lubricantis]
MTSAISNQNTAAQQQRVPVLNRPNMVSVGTILFLSQELMFFAGLFAMYFTSRANGMATGDWAEQTSHLNVIYGLIITIILVSSSVTSQFGVFAAERGDVYGLRKWFTITILLGVVFLGMVAFEYYEMIHAGVTIQSSVYGSVFYIITGFHMAHVTAGIIAFIIILLRVSKSKFTPAQATAAMVVSYYWHFVDVIWIGVFTVLYLIQ